MKSNSKHHIQGQTNSTLGQRLTLILFVTTRTQSYRYRPLWTQNDPHSFKKYLQN